MSVKPDGCSHFTLYETDDVHLCGFDGYNDYFRLYAFAYELAVTSMDIGYGHKISDKWVPKDIPAGLKDINNIEIRTSNKVSVSGCKSTTAIVGKTDDEGFVLFFGTEDASVMWHLNEETINKHNISIIDYSVILVVRIKEKDIDSLFLVNKDYNVISIEDEMYRIIDESGESYLYSPEFFKIIKDNRIK